MAARWQILSQASFGDMLVPIITTLMCQHQEWRHYQWKQVSSGNNAQLAAKGRYKSLCNKTQRQQPDTMAIHINSSTISNNYNTLCTLNDLLLAPLLESSCARACRKTKQLCMSNTLIKNLEFVSYQPHCQCEGYHNC